MHSIQNLKSLFCGWYCVAFCLVMDNNIMPIKSFVQLFEKKDLLKNDLIVTNLIQKIEKEII